MTQHEMSPIEYALNEYMDQMGRKKTNMYLRCTSCDKIRSGVSFVLTGEFLCLDCLLKRKTKELENDPEYIRKERIYNMRKAREKYNDRCK